MPPAFSAVKLRGKRAYELARQGVRVDLEPRKVTVYRLEVLSLDLPDLTLSVECSGGTYIRSLAADLGEALETGAHLRALRRLASGPFTVEGAVRVGELDREAAAAGLRARGRRLVAEDGAKGSGSAVRLRQQRSASWMTESGTSKEQPGGERPNRARRPLSHSTVGHAPHRCSPASRPYNG